MRFVELEAKLNEKAKEKKYSPEDEEKTVSDYLVKDVKVDELFAYLGELKTNGKMYEENYESESQRRQEAVEEEGAPDISEKDLEDMIRKKKLADMNVSSMEQTAPSVKEKWEILKLFSFYQIKAMIEYANSMT